MDTMIDSTVKQRFEHGVLRRLDRLRRRIRLYLLLEGLTAVGAFCLLAMPLTLLIDHTFRLNRDMRGLQGLVCLLILLVISHRTLVGPLRVSIPYRNLALLLEHIHPSLCSRLISAVDFVQSPAVSSRSASMMETVIRQATECTATLPFNQLLAHRRALRRGVAILSLTAILAALPLLAPTTMRLWFQRNVLLMNVDWPRQNQLRVEGLQYGRLLAARGDDVTVTAIVDTGYEPPRQVYIYYQSESGGQGREQMPAIHGQSVRFTHTFTAIDETLRCRITGGDADTGWFTIEVIERPRIMDVTIGIEPPAYTNAPPYNLRPGQTVAEALKGSTIRLHIRTNKPVVETKLFRRINEQETEIPSVGSLSDHEFIAEDRPPESATYFFRLVDGFGFNNFGERTPPVPMTIRLVADQPPIVKMRIRNAGEMLTTEAVLPVELVFSEVYGLASAEMVYQLSEENVNPVAEQLPDFSPGVRAYTQNVDWPVANHDLKEGMRFRLFGQARDFDDVSGPNVGRSATMSFRLVSREELLAELNRREQEYRRDFERLLRMQEELYAQLLTLSTSAQPTTETELRAGPYAQLARRQRDYAGRLNGLRLQFEQNLAELRINRLSSPAVEGRLAGGIIQPMEQLHRTGMPQAIATIEELNRKVDQAAWQNVRKAQEEIRSQMNQILANMLKWEGFQEAVILLRDVLKLQRELNIETQQRIEREIFGNPPVSQPSK